MGGSSDEGTPSEHGAECPDGSGIDRTTSRDDHPSPQKADRSGSTRRLLGSEDRGEDAGRNDQDYRPDIRVHGINGETLTALHWLHFEPLFREAVSLSEGLENTDDVFYWVKERNLQLWAIFEDENFVAAFTTEIAIYPRMKVCRIRHYGGKMNELILEKASTLVAQWAKAYGCSRWEMFGRPGWARVLPKINSTVKVVGIMYQGVIQ